MGGNPRYRLWSRDNWKGYAPTIGHMLDWRIIACCGQCGLELKVCPRRVAARMGADWSPWDGSAACIRYGCHGRMRWRAYNGKADFELWL